jgi:hypothetical protein
MPATLGIIHRHDLNAFILRLAKNLKSPAFGRCFACLGISVKNPAQRRPAAAPRLTVPLLLLTGFPVGVLADLLQQAFGVAITGVQAEGGFALVKSGLRAVQ